MAKVRIQLTMVTRQRSTERLWGRRKRVELRTGVGSVGLSMTPFELIAQKRVHLARLAAKSGAAGEKEAILAMAWVPRPKGAALKGLLQALTAAGTPIKASSFDALAISHPLDLHDAEAVAAALPTLAFIEIKTANQSRVQPGFAGFFFALTESEIAAAEVLGERHRVALHNNLTGELMLTSVPEIVAKARSMTWQLSLQL